MFAQTLGSATLGLNGVIINVEVDISNGIPGFDIVGLPDTSVRESRERVRAAIKNSGFKFPSQRITVNLAPADIRKDSSGLDLPIAIGILAASGYIDPAVCQNAMFISELSLDGKLRPISGILPVVIACLEKNLQAMFVAPQNSQEAVLLGNLNVYAPENLEELVMHLAGTKNLTTVEKKTVNGTSRNITEDFSEVQGQAAAKRALEIAAAGGHNIFILGHKTKPLKPLVNTGAVA